MKQSVFVQQQGVECDFTGSTPWVILSPIEQSIKQKIEAVGTPLKDWDINIYRGVLTGYNDAFIIDTEKREAILANCQTEEERKRTAELIRPFIISLLQHFKLELAAWISHQFSLPSPRPKMMAESFQYTVCKLSISWSLSPDNLHFK